MEKLQSLAEFLGVQDPLQPEAPIALPDAHAEMDDADFCKGVLASTQYRESILRRVLTDSLPPGVETMLWERAHGRVAQRVEHTGKEGKPIEQRVVIFEIPNNGRERGEVVDAVTDVTPLALSPSRVQ
jgi:hypothetical protein